MIYCNDLGLIQVVQLFRERSENRAGTCWTKMGL